MNILITGTLGVGKSHFTVGKILEYIKQGREVYADLDDMKIEGAAPIPEGGWLACPEGSVVIYDEAQKIPDFQFVKGQTVSKNPLIYELADSRKRGYDIIFTTHQPASLHTMLLGFVGEHYNVTRPNNRKESHIALWRKVQVLPNSEAALARAEDVFKEPFDDDRFKLYKSTKLDTHKTRIPSYIKKLIFKAFACFVVIGCILYFSPMLGLFGGSLKTTLGMNKATPETSKGNVITNPLAAAQSSAKQFAQVNQTTGSLNLSNAIDTTPKYDPTKPYSVDYSNYQYQYTDAPHFAGCVIMAGKCKCFSQQGSTLDVEKKTCLAVVHGDGMPFNPFHVDQSVPSVTNMDTNQSIKTQTQIEQSNTRQQSVQSQYEQDLAQRQKEKDDAWTALVQSKNNGK